MAVFGCLPPQTARHGSNLPRRWLKVVDYRIQLKDGGGYGEYLLMLAEEGLRREERFAALRRGWAIGSDTFVRPMHERFAEREMGSANLILLGTDRAGQLQARHAGWEQKLSALADSATIDLSALPAAKSAGPKVFLAAAMTVLTSVSNQWLAGRLQLGKTSVSRRCCGSFGCPTNARARLQGRSITIHDMTP